VIGEPEPPAAGDFGGDDQGDVAAGD